MEINTILLPTITRTIRTITIIIMAEIIKTKIMLREKVKSRKEIKIVKSLNKLLVKQSSQKSQMSIGLMLQVWRMPRRL